MNAGLSDLAVAASIAALAGCATPGDAGWFASGPFALQWGGRGTIKFRKVEIRTL